MTSLLCLLLSPTVSPVFVVIVCEMVIKEEKEGREKKREKEEENQRERVNGPHTTKARRQLLDGDDLTFVMCVV